MTLLTHKQVNRSSFRKIWRALPSLFVAAVCVAVIHAVVNISGYRLAELSFLKISILVVVAAAAIYAAGSTLNQRLCRLNNLVVINLAVMLTGTEVILRVMETSLPLSIVEMLPTGDRERLLKNRGLFVAENISGDGLLYAWKPNSVIASLPWVKIDANGYRNPAVPQSVDIVLLGDSVTIAQNSSRDMGNFLRAQGISAINLGFSGYGPFQQRDAYQKHILDAGIPHRIVLINFCACNDITDAQSYAWILSLGGTWHDYLGSTPNTHAFPFSIEPPWVISLLFNLPYKAVQGFRNQRATAGRSAGTAPEVIRLARGDIQLSDQHLP